MKDSATLAPPVEPAVYSPLPSQVGEPTWEVAEDLFPKQGDWTEEEYFDLAGRIGRRVEFVRGFLDFHGMVSWAHALLCRFLYDWLRANHDVCGGAEPLFAPATVQVVPGEIDREPDVFLLRPGVARGGRRYPSGDDLLAAYEVVSPDRRDVQRDRVHKRAEYAAAGIPEYWIVDPRPEADLGDGGPAGPHVLVLTLPDGADEYVEHGTFRPGDTATSPNLSGLTCDVAALFAAAAD